MALPIDIFFDSPEFESFLDALTDKVEQRLASRTSKRPPDTSADTLCMVTHQLERVAAELQKRPKTPELLSVTQAAKRLGVSRTRTLVPMIIQGRIRTVRINSRVRISVQELAYVAANGFREVAPEPPGLSASSDCSPAEIAEMQAQIRALRSTRRRQP